MCISLQDDVHSYKQPVLMGLVWSLHGTVDTNNLSFPHSEEQHNAREVTTPISSYVTGEIGCLSHLHSSLKVQTFNNAK